MFAVPCILIVAATTASAPPEKAKWEYAELSYRNVRGTPAGTDAEGKEIPAVPAHVAIRWTTVKEEVQLKGWGEMADHLKAVVKKEGSASFLRLQVLNALGSEGWEIVSEQSGSTVVTPAVAGGPDRRTTGGFSTGPTGTTVMFKRRVP